MEGEGEEGEGMVKVKVKKVKVKDNDDEEGQGEEGEEKMMERRRMSNETLERIIVRPISRPKLQLVS